MSINFDALPSGAPNSLPENGKYRAKITKAEMRTPKTDPTKPLYLNLELSLTKNGKGFGKIFDIITESDSDIQRYKLRRLVESLNIPIHGNFELKDLTKIIGGKELFVDVIQEHKDGQRDRAVVDVFSGMIYYPITEATTSETYTETPVDDGDDLPFNASDAEDDLPAPTDNVDY